MFQRVAIIRSSKLLAATLALSLSTCSPDPPKTKGAISHPVVVADPVISPAGRPGAAGHAKMLALLKEIAGRTNDEHYWIGDREVRELRDQLAGLPSQIPIETRWMAQAKLGVWEGW